MAQVDDEAAPRHRPSVVRLSPDYGGAFLWNASPDWSPPDPYRLDPEDLGLSDTLTGLLHEWYEAWESGWGRMSRRFAPTGGSGPASWELHGRRLARHLQKELAPDVTVLYLGEEQRSQDSPAP